MSHTRSMCFQPSRPRSIACCSTHQGIATPPEPNHFTVIVPAARPLFATAPLLSLPVAGIRRGSTITATVIDNHSAGVTNRHSAGVIHHSLCLPRCIRASALFPPTSRCDLSDAGLTMAASSPAAHLPPAAHSCCRAPVSFRTAAPYFRRIPVQPCAEPNPPIRRARGVERNRAELFPGGPASGAPTAPGRQLGTAIRRAGANWARPNLAGKPGELPLPIGLQHIPAWKKRTLSTRKQRGPPIVVAARHPPSLHDPFP